MVRVENNLQGKSRNMIINESYSSKEISEKQALLNHARITLKKEFTGIDIVIDTVIDSITTWFLFPEIQERPLIINLWGMTGVGKTALILRLSNLLVYDKKTFRFDMGNNAKENYSLKNILKNIFSDNNGKPYMLMMDEFQYARTINEDEFEIDNHFSRILWDLLDSGKFQALRNADGDIEILMKCKHMLTQCLKEGVLVEKGYVVEKEEVFLDIISQDEEDDFAVGDPVSNHEMKNEEVIRYSFIPKNLVKDLYAYFKKKPVSIIEFRKMIFQLNGPETIELLEKVIEHGKSNKWVDCSKTVIFILGNLDDAYKMSSSFNPDISADDFHEASKQININHIKKALKKRFRNEQISRLGNNHVIYPAFSSETYRQLILMELEKTGKVNFEKFGIRLVFTENFCNLVYQEGVYPTQGTRPLFSTIYQMVNTKIPFLLSENFLKGLNANKISFDFINPCMKYFFYNDDEKCHELEIPMQLNLEKLRAPEKDDMQAITAVHESGHAIVSMSVSHVLPEYICSTSADAESSGFVVIKNKWNYFSKQEGVRRIAEFMGGLMAEKLIFGDEKITRGAESDIERATQLAAKLVKDYGMGNTIASIDLHGFGSRFSYLDKNDDCNAEVKAMLEQGTALAEKILQQEKQLLLHLANHLSDERLIKKVAIEQLVNQFGSQQLRSISFIEDGKHLFYRAHLKSLVKNHNVVEMRTRSLEEAHISLNKGK